MIIVLRSKSIQLIKGGSSKWVHETFTDYNKFKWQEGYGAFSVSASQINNTFTYINRQKEHYFKESFQDEYISVLEEHDIYYDIHYVW